MLANHTQRSLETAAVKTLARIRCDRGRVVRRLQPLLQHIEEHLFDPSLDVNQLKRSCGVRDNSVPIQFHAQLGLPPHAYIEECRLRTGCRLLRDTDLKIWQIADLLGYSSIQVFSRAFSRWAGMRPTGFRRKARRDGIAIPSRAVKHQQESDVAQRPEAVGEARAKTNGTAAVEAKPKTQGRANGKVNGTGQNKGSRIEVENLRRALDGELEAADADKLIRRLLNLYPGQDVNGRTLPAQPLHLAINGQGTNGKRRNGHPANGNGSNSVEPSLLAIAAGSVAGLLDLEEIETVRAEELWRKIKDEPLEAQVAAVQHEYRFRTPALFHHLCARSLVDGRDNRKRGVRVAELALVALETVKFHITSEKDLAILQGKGYAWLGNARRLAMDFMGADEMLGQATSLLADKSESAPRECAQLFQNTAALRWTQKRYAESMALCEEALALFEQSGSALERSRVLLLRANVHYGLDQDGEAAKDYQQAICLLEGSRESEYLLATAYQSFLVLLVRSGRSAESLPFLEKAWVLAKKQSSKTLSAYLRWNEGLLKQERGSVIAAEEKLVTARDDFVELREHGIGALVALDVALLYCETGRVDEVATIAAQLIPYFEGRKAHGELLVVLGLLQKAIAAKSVNSKLLRRLRAEALRSI